MMVTHHPLHRSGRAALPHPAPTLGDDAKPGQGIRVAHTGRRQPAREVPSHARPRDPSPLAAPFQRPAPQSPHGQAEGTDRPGVHGNAVVAYVSQDHRAEIRPLFWDALVHPPLEFGLDLLQFRLPSLAHRMPDHREPSLPGLPTVVREPQKVEGLRFPLTPPPPMLGRIPAELDQACLVGVQCQSVGCHAGPQLGQEPLGIGPMLTPPTMKSSA